MARWTKKLIRETVEWTNECFRRALMEHYADDLRLWDFSIEGLPHLKFHLQSLGKSVRSPEINELYLKHIRQLSSEQLSLILEGHQKGKQIRYPVTLHAIMDELFERSVGRNTDAVES